MERPSQAHELPLNVDSMKRGDTDYPTKSLLYSGEDVSGLAGEAIMLCLEPLCVRIMQLASFTFSFT
jgi:hypothetical protein